ncbi:hypothetical protein NBRC10512_005919 [Rhodotorula toruloides]
MPTTPAWPSANGRTCRNTKSSQLSASHALSPLLAPTDSQRRPASRLARAAKARLVPLLAASLRLGHLPTSWRDATGVVLKKPKKDDYSLTKLYRLICFERCISKLLESIVARQITHLADTLQLLPPNHFGARPGRSAEDAVVCFVDEIRHQWRNRNVVLGIAIDVAKAFPSVRTEVLVREMEEKGLPRSLCRWTESFMLNRTCTLRLEGVSSEPVNWRSRLPQGSPLSPILFLLYNAGALVACETSTSTAFGWVDDLNVLAWGRSVEEAVSAAQRIVPGLEEWSTTHHSLFEPSKTFVTRFSPARDRSPDDPKVVLCGEELEYSSALGMLGVTIDERLTFKEHMASCASKASKALVGVGLLAKSRGELKAKYVRWLVEAVVLPRLTWCAAAWYKPGTSVSKVLEQVQKAAARIVTGGYRTTSLAALEPPSARPAPDPPIRDLDAECGLAAYSDGSLLETRAGAPAVVRFGVGEEELWGKKARAMGQLQLVYAAELEGARLALDGILQSLSSSTAPSVTLFIDNQSVVRSPFDPSPPAAGQSARLALRALPLAFKYDHPEAPLTMQWLAGHLEVPGNKLVDEEAKRAAGVGDDEVGKSKGGLAGGRSGRRRGPKLFKPGHSSSSSSSADESGWEEDEEERAARLEREVARLGRLDSSTLAGRAPQWARPGRHSAAKIALIAQAGSPRRPARGMDSSLDPLLVARRWSLRRRRPPAWNTLRTSPTFARQGSLHPPRPAPAQLQRLGIVEGADGSGTGLCKCGEAVETRQHYILECSLYSDKRQQLQREIGSSNLKMDKMFSPRFFRPLLQDGGWLARKPVRRYVVHAADVPDSPDHLCRPQLGDGQPQNLRDLGLGRPACVKCVDNRAGVGLDEQPADQAAP